MNGQLNLGQQFELEVFGTCSTEQGNLQKYEYKKFWKCMVQSMIFLKKSGWKAVSPPKDLLITRLLEEVRKILHKKQLPYTVKVYPMVGTQMDYVHGVDGIFTAKPLEHVAKTSEKVAFIPIDISLYPFKEHKMGVIVLNRSSFEEKLTETAQSIVDAIHAQLF